ncbi:MAG: tRNA pseudouridine(55) synthase TruB [Gemmatimonadota bacterium]
MTAGVLAVDKPVGPTSHDVVGVVRRSLGIRQVGHFGTLDPFASGLLVLGVGPATRLAPFCVGHSKTYRATVRLGERSDTDDSEGAIVPVAVPVAPCRAAVESACAAWVGSVRQVPPAYSAKHVDGRRAYALARAGETVTLEAVAVRIDSIEVERYQWPDLDIVVRCGPGTYVRGLARDLGEELGTGAHCAALRRLASGPFRVEDALAWRDLSDPATARAAVMPSWRAVAELPAAIVDAEGQRAFAQGRETRVPLGGAVSADWVRVHGPRGFLGMGQVGDGEEGALRLHPRRVLFPDGEDSG